MPIGSEPRRLREIQPEPSLDLFKEQLSAMRRMRRLETLIAALWIAFLCAIGLGLGFLAHGWWDA